MAGGRIRLGVFLALSCTMCLASVAGDAVLYTNADGVLNDDAYEYEQVADPFMADLGQVVLTQLRKMP